MLFKRFTVCVTACALLLGLGLATAAQAKRFSVTGGGGQNHIGNGLALPIQAAITVMGTAFPTLLIPVKAGAAPVVVGTTAAPLQTATSGMVITKSGYQRKLVIPANVLSKPGGQKTVGVKFSNPLVFAVGTNLNYKWPAAPAVFSTGQVGTATATVSGFGGTLTYSNTLGQRFGGPAAFSINSGTEPAGLIGVSPVTVYIKINATTPPCTHNAFGGAKPGCVAGIMLAKPTGIGAIGGPATVTVMTPGVKGFGKNVAIMKMGAVPLGTVIAKALAATNTAIPTNMASSQGGPWTTGQVVISQPLADMSAGEKFTLSGKDSRTAGGNGTIQLVAGSVSKRNTGPNGNRGWLRLVLGNAPAASVPSMSTGGIAATVALIVLGFGYAMRRRIFS